MNPVSIFDDRLRVKRCAIYTRKSTEEGLDQEFNSLDAQREAAEAFIQSQRREGWIAFEPYAGLRRRCPYLVPSFADAAEAGPTATS